MGQKRCPALARRANAPPEHGVDSLDFAGVVSAIESKGLVVLPVMMVLLVAGGLGAPMLYYSNKHAATQPHSHINK